LSSYGNPDSVVVNVYSGDTLITWGTANLFREDLKAAGKGEGNHGFNIPLPPDTDTSSLRFVIEGGTEIAHNQFTTAVSGIPASFEAGKDGLTTVWLDITDLIHYVRHHKTVSGIQRVQCELVRLIVSNDRFRIRFCITTEASTAYYEIPFKSIETLINRIDANSSIPFAEWAGYVSTLADTSRLRRAEIVGGDMLFLLGAFWNFPDSIHVINSLRDSGVRVGVYIYDLIPLYHPEYCDRQLVKMFVSSFAMLSQIVDLVFTISQYTADDVARFYRELGQKPKPIKPILLAHEMRSSGADASRKLQPRSSLIDPAEGPFVLCVCTIEIRKNHIYLLRVWRELLRKHGKDRVPKLILVGRRGWRVDDFFAQLEGTDYLDNHIRVMHDLSDADLQSLYQNCLFTVFPSFCEGWGLPVGESLVMGKICIASQTTSLPEVGKEFAISIDPDNVSDGLQTIERYIFDDALRTKTENDLRKRFRPRGWQEVAATFVDELDKFLRETGEAWRPAPSGLVKLGSLARLSRADIPCNVEDMAFNHPGQQLVCSKGWHRPEPWGKWMNGRAATISLSLDTANTVPSKVRVYLEMVVPDEINSLKLKIASECGAVRQIHAAKPGPFFASIDCDPRAASSGIPRIRLSLQVDRDFLLPEPDGRRLGLGIRSIGLVDPNDVMQRLEFMENLLFMSKT
jgi:glycosyltransferase involved in cell wall biosynthesis